MQGIGSKKHKNKQAVWTVFLCIAVFLSNVLAANGAGPDGLDNHSTAIVATVIDGDTLTLDDGREIRLVGIQAPKLPLGRAGFSPWPLADIAKKEMENISLGKKVTVYTGTTKTDRHGRMLAHLMVGEKPNQVWLQGEMLRLGLARVYSFADNRALVDEMLSIEKTARKNGNGIWADPFYKIIQAAQGEKYVGTFQLVEGKVLAAQTVGPRTYINFGPVWRTDFTVLIEKNALKVFAKSNIDPISYQGKFLRVRGWIKSNNGPMVEVTHPEQIEIIK